MSSEARTLTALEKFKRRGSVMRYAVVIEQANGNYAAYVPDLPGCVATGTTLEEVGENIREAIRLHLG